MARQKRQKTSPRKSPRQRRSQDLVDAIMMASMQLVRKSGLQTTTNHIAELAGVSVGSLYQYFPNKDSIFAQLIDRELVDNENRILARAHELQGESLDMMVHGIVEISVHRFLDRADTLRELLGSAFRLKRVQAIVSSRSRANEELARILAGHQEVDAERDLVTAAEVATGAVMGVLQQVALSHREDEDRTVLISELSRLVTAYLR